MAFIIRWVFALVLLAATYNPTRFNFVEWAMANYSEQLPLTVLFALILLVAYIVFITAVLRGIGAFGVILLLAVVGALVWVLFDFGLISLQNPGVNTWIALLGLSFVLAVGMYWGILWRRISGQVEVDEGDA